MLKSNINPLSMSRRKNQTNPTKYKAFISYTRSDRAFAEWFHKRLEEFPIPRSIQGTLGRHGTVPAILYPIFHDRDELSTAANLSNSVHEALEKSEALVVLCSPDSARSKWVNLEVQTFKDDGRFNRIIPVIVAGGEALEISTGLFPPSLRSLVSDGGNEPLGLEPLAADARDHADGRDNALLKVVSSLIGVDYELLKGRHAAYMRKVKWARRALLSVCLVIALYIAGTALWRSERGRDAAFRTASSVLATAGTLFNNEKVKRARCRVLWADSELNWRRKEYENALGMMEACASFMSEADEIESKAVFAANNYKLGLANRGLERNEKAFVYFRRLMPLLTV